jgi:hypothetical protein
VVKEDDDFKPDMNGTDEDEDEASGSPTREDASPPKVVERTEEDKFKSMVDFQSVQPPLRRRTTLK